MKRKILDIVIESDPFLGLWHVIIGVCIVFILGSVPSVFIVFVIVGIF